MPDADVRAGVPATDSDESATTPVPPGFGAVLIVVAVILGAAMAARLAWMSDDAYISFRYAEHLARGMGLVYNAGERVEGYTNFLWTVWCALGIRLGFAAESWATVSSIACFAATLAILGALAWRRRRMDSPLAGVPFAALLVAANRDACVFATAGLETALFTLLAVTGYAALEGIGETLPPDAAAERARKERDLPRAALAALALGLACLTRPDGVVFAAVGGAWVAYAARRRMRAVAAYAVVLAAIGVPYALWKLAYYGDLLPNTYYAKSAAIAWWDQGAVYVGLYFRKYPELPAGVLIAAVLGFAAWRGRTSNEAADDPHALDLGAAGRPALLASGFAIAYTLYVARVGGDFMFARLMIPATPFFALALEHVAGPLAKRAEGGSVHFPASIAALLVVLFVAAAQNPFPESTGNHGIVDERAYYAHPEAMGFRYSGADLRELTHGLQVRIAFSGAEAIVAYQSDVPVAIEAVAGLTDAYVAHQKLAHRGRVGHEKRAPFSYLIARRRVHFVIGQSRNLADSLRAYIPVLLMSYKSVKATLLTWDPTVMAELRRRGAQVDDFTAYLDRFIAEMPRMPDPLVAEVYLKSKQFYFDGVRDTAREEPFLRRLAGAGAGTPP
jgi:hypothetical protein